MHLWFNVEHQDNLSGSFYWFIVVFGLCCFLLFLLIINGTVSFFIGNSHSSMIVSYLVFRHSRLSMTRSHPHYFKGHFVPILKHEPGSLLCFTAINFFIYNYIFIYNRWALTQENPGSKPLAEKNCRFGNFTLNSPKDWIPRYISMYLYLYNDILSAMSLFDNIFTAASYIYGFSLVWLHYNTLFYLHLDRA